MYSFIWDNFGVHAYLTEDPGKETLFFIAWENVESVGVALIKEKGQYEQALVSQRALMKGAWK